MGLISKTFLSVAVFSLLAQPVAAQSLDEWEREGRVETRAMASFTIPLGGGRSVEQTAPRLDFAMQNYRIGSDQNAPLRFDVRSQPRALQRQSIVSLTLDQQPKLLLNGQRVATFGPTLHADEEGEQKSGGGNTALYVIGGVLVLAAGATAILATDARDAVSDAIGPAD